MYAANVKCVWHSDSKALLLLLSSYANARFIVRTSVLWRERKNPELCACCVFMVEFVYVWMPWDTLLWLHWTLLFIQLETILVVAVVVCILNQSSWHTSVWKCLWVINNHMIFVFIPLCFTALYFLTDAII